MDDLKTDVEIRRIDERQYDVYTIQGFLDAHTAQRLSDTVEAALKKGRAQIVFDLSGLNYISSIGFGTLIALQNSAQEKGGDLKIAAVGEKTQRIFDLLGFVHIMGMYETIDDAIAAFEEEG